MKLSELKPCACCKGPLISASARFWYCVRVSQVILDPKAMRDTIGLMQIMGGRDDAWTLKVAETLSPNAEAATILGDKERALMTELHICFECMIGRFGDLMGVVERVCSPEDSSGSAAVAPPPAEAHHVDLSITE